MLYMEWLVLFMLILIGFVLLILEFLVFPGVNVAGILGFACGNRYLYRLFYNGNDGWAFHFARNGSLWFRGDLLRLTIEDVETYAVTHAD